MGKNDIDQGTYVIDQGHVRLPSQYQLSPDREEGHMRLTSQSHMSSKGVGPQQSTVCLEKVRFTSQSQMSLHRGTASSRCQGQLRLTGQSQMSPHSGQASLEVSGTNEIDQAISNVPPQWSGLLKGTNEIGWSISNVPYRCGAS